MVSELFELWRTLLNCCVARTIDKVRRERTKLRRICSFYCLHRLFSCRCRDPAAEHIQHLRKVGDEGADIQEATTDEQAFRDETPEIRDDETIM